MAMGGLAAGNVNIGMQASNQIAAPTLSSAISKVDGINTRLADAIKNLQMIHDQIGGPRPVGDSMSGKPPQQSGAIHRINDSAQAAHDQLGELEGLISLVQRALG